MNGRGGMVWRSWRWAPILALAVLGACARPGAGPGVDERLEGLDPGARRLFAQVEQEHRLRRDVAVLELGEQLLAAYPDHPRGDLVTAWMIDAAVRTGDLDRVHALGHGFARRFAGSDRRDAAMLAAAAGLEGGGRPVAALGLLAGLAAGQQGEAREATIERGRPLITSLDDARLRDAAARLADTPLLPIIAEQLAERGLSAVVPGAVVAAEAGRLGVLTPLTGRYARFGNAFQAAVHLAVDAVPAPVGQTWQVVLEDTEGDVVGGALAARKLITEQRCQLLIGALLSAPTATAALVADHFGVPLISPSATNERLELLSDHVLQTNLTGRLEAEILAHLAVSVLLKERFGVIRPDTPEGASMAAHFRAAVTALGGTILREVVFDPSVTDFRTPVLELRAVRPEVIFVPATVDQMILLGPQLDFYQVGALVMGPSEWNSGRLLQRAGSVMEHAVFAASEVVYPAAWSHDFASAWPSAQHDEESTRIARGAYLATRLALRIMAERPQGAGEAASTPLSAALRRGFGGRAVALDDAASYASALRWINGGEIAPFPGDLYAEALRRDALAAAAADSVPDAAAD